MEELRGAAGFRLKRVERFEQINARIRRWGIRPRPIYSRTDPKGRDHFPDEGSALKLPGFNAVISRMDVFALRQCPIAVHSKCLLGGQGSAGTRPEHRCKSGRDGGFTAAILINPPLYLRTLDFLSKRWGPPH